MVSGLGAWLAAFVVTSPAVPETNVTEAVFLAEAPAAGDPGLLLRLDGRRTLQPTRVPWRYGLPIDPGPQFMAPGMQMQVFGVIPVRAGTIAHFMVDGEDVREIAGHHIVRVDNVPGLWIQLGNESPFEAGAGGLAVIEREDDGALRASARAVLFQFAFRM